MSDTCNNHMMYVCKTKKKHDFLPVCRNASHNVLTVNPSSLVHNEGLVYLMTSWDHGSHFFPLQKVPVLNQASNFRVTVGFFKG